MMTTISLDLPNDLAEQLRNFDLLELLKIGLAYYPTNQGKNSNLNLSDEHGENVTIPLSLWQEILSERETAYLLKSPAMKKRLLIAINRQDGIPFEVVCEKLGI